MKRWRPVLGDITKIPADAIVNAANSSLLGGGGVDGAIHRAAGPKLLEECRTLGGCPAGEVRKTLAYRLPAKYVFHTVGPIWHGGSRGEDKLLASCYRNCLNLAAELQITSISFPAISTGVYGFPSDRACKIAVHEIENFPDDYPKDVVLVCFDQHTFNLYSGLLRE